MTWEGRRAWSVTVPRGVDGVFEGSGGHRLTIPAAASPVTLSDSFSLSGTGEFSRADSLRIQPSGGLSVAVEARAVGTAQALAQSWTAALDVRPVDRLDLGLDLLLSQSSTGYPLADAWYGARWAREAGLLAPVVRRRDDRTARAALGAHRRGHRSDRGRVLDRRVRDGHRLHGAHARPGGPIDESWSVAWPAGGGGTTASWSRCGTRGRSRCSGTRAAAEPFTAETADFFRLLGDQRWFLLGLPLVEILLDDTDRILAAWDGLDEAAWNPSLSISVERRAGSRACSTSSCLSTRRAVSVSRARTTRRPFRNEILDPSPGRVPRAQPVRQARFAPGRPISTGPTSSASRSRATVSGDRRIRPFAVGAVIRAVRRHPRVPRSVPHAGERLHARGRTRESVTDGLQATFDWTTRPAGGVRLPYLPETDRAHRVLRAPGEPRSRPAVRSQPVASADAAPRPCHEPRVSRPRLDQSRPQGRIRSRDRCPVHRTRTGSRSRQASRQSCLFK